MTGRSVIRIACVCGLVVAAFTARAEAATLRDARVTVVFSSAGCDVTSRFVVDTSEPEVVDHHVMLSSDAMPRFVVLGAIAGQASVVGRTARVPMSLTGSGRNEYSVRYSIALPLAARDRCPMLVPGAPTDGVTRGVRLEVEVPAGASRLPGEFPAFAWDGARGAVAISHMPSFVRIPHLPEGSAVTWRDRVDVRRILDAAAVTIIGVSTLAWVALRRRQP
jgi:hypothetical protein